ncbi:MAG TPA: methionine--tRNA ligase, partial [Nitrososphaeria archaeon]|nr:methionine--tRNA ligase [Nitrososphaeria archaeon]
KDNLFFHTILFPALLIAHGDYILPYNVVVNEFVNLEGEKLSTSRGWVVWLHDLLAEYDPDVIRYYATAIAPETRDTDFKWQDFAEKINGELIGTYGNFIHRVLSFVYSRMGGVVPEPGKLGERDQELLNLRTEYAKRLEDALEGCEFRKGLRIILEFAQEGNIYLNEKAPWKNPEEAGTTLYTLIQVVHALAVLSAPYLPFSSQRILDYLNTGERVEELRWSDVEKIIPPGHRIREPKPLFRKITKEEIDEKLRRLREIKSKTGS